jgi:hypothetical protein
VRQLPTTVASRSIPDHLPATTNDDVTITDHALLAALNPGNLCDTILPADATVSGDRDCPR